MQASDPPLLYVDIFFMHSRSSSAEMKKVKTQIKSNSGTLCLSKAVKQFSSRSDHGSAPGEAV